MDESAYLDRLASDYGDLRDAATAAELSAPVPGCPGWTLSDLVFHVAEVYLHKARIMRTGEWPDPWPPPGLRDEAPVPLLGRAFGELMAEFAAHDADTPVPTWYDPDQTVAFWIRRMAQETVIHRIDAEQAAGLPVTAVPGDLAIDGVDEVLKRFLAYASVNWPEDFAKMPGGHLAGDGNQDTITVAAGPVSWTVLPSPREVRVEDGRRDDTRTVISAAPDLMLRWLWGRASDDAIAVSGDPDWAGYLRRMLAEVTE
jgi:uncharacterized protein (TIGR03083 family)